jgi:hypothetical protein
MLTLPLVGGDLLNIPKNQKTKNSMKSHTTRTSLSCFPAAEISLAAALAAIGLLAFAGQSRAAVVISYASGGAGIYEPYSSVVSSTDAANVGSSDLSSLSLTTGSAIYGSSASYMNDGIVYDPGTMNDRGNTAWTLTPSDGSQVTIEFNTGLNVTGINTFAMSGGGQARSAQDYGLEYLTGGNWTTLFSNLNTSDANNIDAGNTSTWVNLDLTSYAGGSLVNVDALRFTFHNVGGDETLYREIDVMAVPEPSSVTLFGAAIGGVVLLRRRRGA